MKEKQRQEQPRSGYLQTQPLPYQPSGAFPLDSPTSRNLTLPHMGHIYKYTHTHTYTPLVTETRKRRAWPGTMHPFQHS